MTDVSRTFGSRTPTNIIAGTGYNPLVGPTSDHPDSFPIGTPVVASTVEDAVVIPGRANSDATTFTLGLSATPGVVGGHANIQSDGVMTLTEGQWDALTGDAGGLIRGLPYYLSSGPTDGGLTHTITSTPGNYVAKVGIALSSTDLLIQIGTATLVVGPPP